MKKYRLKNLDCANCAANIENKLNSLEGVRSAKVVFATKSLMIDASDMGAVRNAIKDMEPDVEIAQGNKGPEEDYNVKKELLTLGAYIALFAASALWIGFSEKPISYFGFAGLLLVYFLAGKDVILTSFKNIAKGRIFDENFLMTFATLAAFAIGAWTESVAVMLFYRAGEFFQGLAVNRSRRSIKSLVEVRPDYAVVVRDGKETRISPEDAAIGETVVIRPGEKIPLDGVITKGSTTVDSRALTGESVPRGAKAGDNVMAGTLNLTGLIQIKTLKPFEETSAAKILDLVENAAANKAKTETFIASFARYYTPVVFFLSLAVAVFPPLFGFGSFSEWIYRALVVLVVSCPCALIISVPLGYFGGIGGASRNGVLIKGANYLEALAQVKAAAFDKTGTLTKGVFKVTEIYPHNGFTKESVLKYAAMAEAKSNHPIAQSIREAGGAVLRGKDIDEYEEIGGHGVKVTAGDMVIMAGSDRLLHKYGVDHDPSVCNVAGGVAHVAVDGAYAGYIVISDELKDEAGAAVRELKKLGVTDMAVLTGDNRSAAEKVLEGSHIGDYYTDLLPEDKARIFKEFAENALGRGARKRGKSLFAGDGINDAPVLASADIGVSMGAGGSEAAIETADVVIMDDSLMKIADGIKIAKKTRAIIWQNIIFALGVKLAFVILGLFGVATIWEAVFGDVGVALLALLNSMRILKYRPSPQVEAFAADG